MRPHLTVEQRWLAMRLKAGAVVARDLPAVSAGQQTVTLIAPHTSSQPVRQNSWVPGSGRITLADEEESILALHAGESPHSVPAADDFWSVATVAGNHPVTTVQFSSVGNIVDLDATPSLSEASIWEDDRRPTFAHADPATIGEFTRDLAGSGASPDVIPGRADGVRDCPHWTQTRWEPSTACRRLENNNSGKAWQTWASRVPWHQLHHPPRRIIRSGNHRRPHPAVWPRPKGPFGGTTGPEEPLTCCPSR
jgi:hypothetical protein